MTVYEDSLANHSLMPKQTNKTLHHASTIKGSKEETETEEVTTQLGNECQGQVYHRLMSGARISEISLTKEVTCFFVVVVEKKPNSIRSPY